MTTQLFQSSRRLRRAILLCFMGFLLVEATLFLWARNPFLYAPGNRKVGFGLVAFRHWSLRSVQMPVDSQGNVYVLQARPFVLYDMPKNVTVCIP